MVAPLRLPFSKTLSSNMLAFLYGTENSTRAMLSGVLPFEAVRILHSEDEYSITLIIAGVFSILLTVSSGRLIRIFSRKFVFTLSYILALVSCVLFVVAEYYSTHIAFLLRAIGASLGLICLSLYVLDFVHPNAMIKVESRRVTYAAITWTIGPTLGIQLWHMDYRYPFILGAILIIFQIIFFWYLRIQEKDQITPPKDENTHMFSILKRYIQNKHLRIAYLIAFTRSAFWVINYAFLPLYVLKAGFDTYIAGYLLGVIGVMLLLAPIIAKYATQIGVRKSIILSMCCGGFLHITTGLLLEPALIGLLLIVFASFFNEVSDVVGNLPFLKVVKPSIRTEMTLVFSTFRDLSQLITPMLVYIILFLGQLQDIFWIFGIWMIFVGYLAMRLPRIVD